VSRAVFDTSAILPCMTPHPCSAPALLALEHYQPVLLTFVQAEFANALRNLVKAKVIEAGRAQQTLSILMRRFGFEDFHPFVPAALELALAFDHPAYDCLYVAAAQALGLPLITSDKRLARKFSSLAALSIVNLYEMPETLP
jgi:predicted nucleic acid-binding protein